MSRREIEYDLTADDFVAFAVWSRRHTGGFRYPWLMRGLALGVIVVIVAVGAGFRDTAWEEFARVVMAVLSAILFLLIYFAMPPSWLGWQASSAIRRRFAQDPHLQKELSRQWLALTPNGVERRGGTGESFAPWANYNRVDCSGDYLFFYQSANIGYPVPRRAFADDASLRDFAEYARTCIEKSGMTRGEAPARTPFGPPGRDK